MDGGDVRRAVAEMARVLGPHEAADWSLPAGPLEWSCWTTAAHIAHDLLAYAGQLAHAGEAGSGLPYGGAVREAEAYLPFDLRVAEGASPGEVIQVVVACGGLLSAALATADPGVRAWHWGPCDPAGFAAMGVAETILHTHDITRGLGVAWQPPATLCAGVLDRLFPDAPQGDPVRVLLWATGRGELEGRPRVTSWVWRAALPPEGS
ncbi:maleylpyruvate isomerase N-terminal domain-containing protein [Thermocatellispora tengchongensis]|nr:maleylpyruvate isomerase N-terminal domain-containing protein [Thermocatellispora tengchongensis]